MRVSQNETGLERLAVTGAKNLKQAYGGSIFCLLFGGAEWEGGRGPLHTHSHTHSVSADRKRKCLAFSSRLSPGQA